MGEAVQVTIAKFVEQQIEMASLSQKGFALERSYADWDLDLTKMDSLELGETEKLRVDVASHTTQQAAELSSRTTLQYTSPIDIAVRRKFGANKRVDESGRIETEEIDALVLFVQEIHVLLVKLRSDDDLCAVWQGAEIVASPVREHLRDLGQFTGIVRITFRADVKI